MWDIIWLIYAVAIIAEMIGVIKVEDFIAISKKHFAAIMLVVCLLVGTINFHNDQLKMIGDGVFFLYFLTVLIKIN